jgi:subtilase family serine protease
MGDKVTLTAYVKNEGSLKAACSSRLYFCIDDDMVNYQEIPPLDAGERAVRMFEWDVMAGQHILSLRADGADVITEGVEDNNVETVEFSIAAPDLVIESITWPSGEPSTSDNVTFTVTIRNQGDASSRYVPISYYVDGQYLASGQIRSLKPDADTHETFSTWIPRTGSHTIRVVIDEGNQLPESNEANNEKVVNLSTENITSPEEKPAPVTSSNRPTPIPLTPPEEDYKTEMMFGIAVVLFGGILILTLLRTVRKQKGPPSDKGEI